MKDEHYTILIEEINNFVISHSLNLNDILLILKQQRKQNPSKKLKEKYGKVDQAAQEILEKNSIPKDIKAFGWFVYELTETFEINLSVHFIRSSFNKFISRAAVFSSILVFLFISFMVIGGIFTGKSNYNFFDSPVFSFAILIFLILVLAALEGTQICVTLLRMKDLESVKNKYPRAYSIHRKIKNEMMTRKYLAGRQLLVIMIIFIVAQITSFKDFKNWPFTEQEFFPFMIPWFETIFLNLGVLGAFLVLWTGQLLPQYLANRHPQRFLNIPLVPLVIRLAWTIEKIGLNKPWEWLANTLYHSELIPTSQKELYQQEVNEFSGYGSLCMKKEWYFKKNTSTASYKNSVIIMDNSVNNVYDDVIKSKSGSTHTIFNYKLIRNNLEIKGGIYFRKTAEEKLDENWIQFTHTLEPKKGSFLEGDIIIVENECKYNPPDHVFSSDEIMINIPTKYLIFRVYFDDNPRKIGDGIIEGYDYNELTGKYMKKKEQIIKLTHSSGSSPFFEFISSYPKKYSYYAIKWEIEY